MNRPYKSRDAIGPQNLYALLPWAGVILGDSSEIIPENLPKMRAKVL